MALKSHDEIDEINETIREYMKIPDRDPSKLYEDLGEMLKRFCPEWGPSIFVLGDYYSNTEMINEDLIYANFQ